MYREQAIPCQDEAVAEEILHRALIEGALWVAFMCDPDTQGIRGVYVGWDDPAPKKPSKVML